MLSPKLILRGFPINTHKWIEIFILSHIYNFFNKLYNPVLLLLFWLLCLKKMLTEKTYKSIKKKTKITFFLHFFIEINVHKIKFIILTIFKYIFLWQLVHWHSCTKINSTINLQNFFLSFPSETVLIKWPLSLPFPQPLATTVTISVSEFDYCLYLMSAESCCMFLFVTDLFHLLYNVFKFNPSWEYVLEFPSFEAE